MRLATLSRLLLPLVVVPWLAACPAAPAPNRPAASTGAPGRGAAATVTVPADSLPAAAVSPATVPADTVPADTVPAATVPAATVPAATVPAATVPAAPMPASLAGAISRLERELAADVAADSVGSVAAAVFVGDEVVWKGALGWRDRSSRELATPAAIYRAGSLAKPVTALVLLRLVEDGVIGLDDPVAPHLPELLRLPGPEGPVLHARAITFRHLATHTAGLDREPEPVTAYARGPFRSWKRRVVDAIPGTRALNPPGHLYAYSNIGYGLLGFALERAAGRPFEVLADSLVFRPLGMADASLFLPRDDRRRLATGYVNVTGDSVDPRVPRAEHRGRGYRVPSGGLYGTVDDLARLGMALTGARPLLTERLRQRMLADAMPPDGLVAGRPATAVEAEDDPPGTDPPGTARGGYGIGVQRLEVGGATLIGHSGTVAGYTAYLLVDPERQTGVVLVRNYNQGATNLGAAASRLLLDLRDDP